MRNAGTTYSATVQASANPEIQLARSTSTDTDKIAEYDRQLAKAKIDLLDAQRLLREAREFNTKGDEIDSWDQHNMALIYNSTDGKWNARAWVRNIQDEENITGDYLTSDTSGYFRNYFLTEPKIYGLTVRYNFGE